MKSKHTNKNAIKKMVTWLVLSSLLFLGINVAFRYLLLFLKFAKNIEKHIENPPGYFDFKLDYMITPPENVDLIMIILGAISVGLYLTYKLNLNTQRKNANKNVDGSARWMSKSELKKTLYAVDERKISQAKQSGIVLARQGRTLYVDTDTTHNLIIGTTRSGKGQTFVLPMIRMLASGQQKQNLILNDPKGELLENTYKILHDNGYKIMVLNLVDTNKSHLWNPLQVIIDEYVSALENGRDISKANKLINGLADVFTSSSHSDPIWPTSARSLLTAMILYLLDVGYREKTLDKLNMYSVYNFFIEYGGRNDKKVEEGYYIEVNALDNLFKDLPVGHPAKLAYATSNFAQGEMRSSIFATLANNIELFGSDVGISKITSRNEIDFSSLTDKEKPCAIFMVVPDEDASRHVLASLFVTQCYASLIDQSRAYPMQKLPRRVQFILDEFGNMVKIPEMDIKITISLGRNIIFNLFVQDLNQLDSKYQKTAKTIRSNCGNIIYIYSIDIDTNKYVSQLLGNETVEYRTYSGKLNEFLNSQSLNIKSRPLISHDELSVLKMGETVVKKQRCYPIMTKFKPFYTLKLPMILLDKLPLKYQDIKLEETLFPFSVIDKKNTKEVNAEAEAQTPAEIIQSFDEVNAEIEDPYIALATRVDELTDGEFSTSCYAGDLSACRKQLNSLKLKKLISEEDYQMMVLYLKEIKGSCEK